MNILYVFPKNLYASKMSLGRVLYGEALQAQHGVDLRWFGTGWPGYDVGRSLRHNVDALDVRPDCLWSYKAHLAGGPYTGDLPSLVIFNEANNHSLVKTEVEAANATLVGFHHESDIARCEAITRTKKFFCIPHGAPIDPLAGPLAERKVDCLVTGVLSKDVYPLRCRLANLIQTGRLPGKVRQHPGYRLDGHEAIRRQYEEYRADLRDAKISLCCPSKYSYFLAKYVESYAAGCLVAGGFPDDSRFRKHFAEHSLELSDSDSDDQIVAKVMWQLEHLDESQKMADASRRAFLNGFTLEHYAIKLRYWLDVMVMPAEV